MNQLIKSKGINFGLVYGLALILPILYAYTIDLNYFVSFWALGILILTFFIHGFWVIGSLKKAQNGYATFKEAFTVFFISNALGFLISAVITLLIFTVIDPELQTVVKELTVQKTTTFMLDMGANSDQIEETIKGIEEQDNYSIGAQVKGYFLTVIIASIVGLLLSLILKKKQEEEY